MTLPRRLLLLTLLTSLLFPAAAHAAGVQPAYDVSAPAGAPFPSDRWTTPDWSNLTGLRVDLPKPDCTARPSDCADVDVLNSLDGFNLQPRISIPFTGAIDPTSVSSSNVFLVRLPDGAVTGIDQITWEPAASTLHVEPADVLRQATSYVLVVTTGVRAADGSPIGTAGAKSSWHGESVSSLARAHYVPIPKLAVASVFTTQSATPLLEQVRRQIDASSPAPASFLLGTNGERTVFPLGSVTGIVFGRQIGVAPLFSPSAVAVPALSLYPGSVGTVAFGSYASPDYEDAARTIPPTGTRTGIPAVQGTNLLYFNLFLPAGPAPAAGWPVALFGHGFGDNKNSSPVVVASSLARRGVATIAINVVGHGGGPLGTLTVNRSGGAPPVVLPAGGREIDQDGNGFFNGTEGVNAAPPATLIASRDGLRQTVIDLMALVRAIQVGMDVDGNGSPDLDPARISFAGQSFGGIYGTMFLAVEPDVAAGVPNVPGGSVIEIARLGGFRPLVTQSLGLRVPGLLNAPGGFVENMPLRGLPPLVDSVPGASAIQEVLDNTEWASQSGNPVAFAEYLRSTPLPGVPAKSVLFQFARGDKTVPNPTTTAILRAGGLADRATLFRNDLAFAANPATPKNPHTFLTSIGTPSVAAFALAGQDQLAQFLASGGAVTIDPDGPGPFFETPVTLPLPEDLAYIP